jgi:hypothetical protein
LVTNNLRLGSNSLCFALFVVMAVAWLKVGADGTCSLSAPTTWGALRGLETLSQALRRLPSGMVVAAQTPLFVSDAPRFSHRGLLVDTSRHFLPVEALQAAIDALVYSKLNVLHWHMVDAQVGVGLGLGLAHRGRARWALGLG